MKQALCAAAIVILLAGCTGGGEPTTSGPSAKPEAVSAPSDAKPAAPAPVRGDCPEGTFQFGAEPPQGFEKWCHKEVGGTWIKHGPYAKWFKNGKPEATGEYADGVQAGRWTEYGETGNKSEGEYAAGKRTGTWTLRHPDGMREVGAFASGERDGAWTIFWDEKEVRKEAGKFVAGKRDGVWTYYDQNDLPTGEATYKAGELVATKQIKRVDKPQTEAAAPAAPKADAKAPAESGTK
jgi:hypothetical protein